MNCGYDLEGLEARGTCPECGRSILESLAVRLDLETPSFEPVPNAPRVAATILLGSLGCVGGALVFAVLLFDIVTSLGTELPLSMQVSGWITRWAPLGIALMRLLAFVGTSTGCVAFLMLLPWRRDRRFIRAKILGSAGFALWLALAIPEPTTLGATMTSLPAAMALLAIAPLLRDLGPRSRAYRNARATAQRIGGLLFSTGIAGGSSLAAEILVRNGPDDDTVLFLRIVACAAASLTLVGLVYLVLNAVWIARASVRPLLTVAETFGDESTDVRRPPTSGD